MIDWRWCEAESVSDGFIPVLEAVVGMTFDCLRIYEKGAGVMGVDIRELLPKDTEGRLRIIQETVPGRQITLAHVITSPKPIVYRKLGLNPDIDFERSAIGIITVTPSESAVIGADIAIKSGDVYLGFVDRFSGTLILTGRISSVESALQAVIHYFQNELGYATCPLTKK